MFVIFQGCTPSTATGPCNGHDGSSSSYYIFLETSSGSTGMTASLNTNVTFDCKIYLRLQPFHF